jgi:hypothetical protein
MRLLLPCVPRRHCVRSSPKVCTTHRDSIRLLKHALVAQRLEQRTHNPLVVGSNPTEGMPLLFIVGDDEKIS